MKYKIAIILKWLAKIWSFLVILSVIIGAVGIFVYEGWWKLTEVFSPFNFINYLTILIILSPAIGAHYLSEYLLKN